jgi:hypothetical protein
MKTRGSRTNNGYIGIYEGYEDTTGIVSANKKYNINNYNVETSSFWTRPTEWVPLPSVSIGEQKIVGTYAVYNTDNNFVAFTIAGGGCDIDWGDGTTGAVAAGVAAYKNYTQSTYSGLTSAVYQGYKTLNITITASSGATWNGNINLCTKHNQSGLQSYYTNGWLDVRMSAPSATSLTMSDTTFNNQSRSHLLQRFSWIGDAPITSYTFIGSSDLRIIENFPSTERVTNYQSIFHTCHNLEWIHPNCVNSRICTNWNFAYYLCNRLKQIPAIHTDNATALQQVFQDCLMLERVPYMNTSKATNMNGMFNGCYSLKEVPELDTSAATNLSALFGQCRSLKKIPATLNTTNCTNMSTMFLGCLSLDYAPTMDTRNVSNFSGMFNTSGVRSVPEYNYSKATDISNMFRFCRQLTDIGGTMMNTGLSLTTATEAFYECYSINKLPHIQNLTNVTNTTGMFFNCRGVKEYGSMDWKSVTNTGGTATTTRMFYQNWSLSRCQITGITATVSFESCSLGATALNEIYTNLGPGAGKTIVVTGNWGTAADDPTIATAKGWTVTG